MKPANPANPAEMVVTLSVAQLRDIVRAEISAALDERSTAPEFIDQATLAEQLGVSERTIYTLRREGLPCVMLGSETPRFKLADAVDWLRTRDVKKVAAELRRINAERGEPEGDQFAVVGELARRAIEAGLQPGQEVALGNATFKRGKTKTTK